MHAQWFHNCLISACYLWLVVSAINYFRPKPQPIRPIDLEEAVDYLINKSLWGQQQYKKYDYIVVRERAIEEIVTKARLGLITIKGWIPNRFTTKELDKHYWKRATLEYSGSFLFTKCTDINSRFDFITYDSLEITSQDIKIIWKPSSRPDRFFYYQYV
jgi:hypothetical protein